MVKKEGSSDYTVCSNFPGTVGFGATQILQCDELGRYVRIQLNGSRRQFHGANYLTLCEVQVIECECLLSNLVVDEIMKCSEFSCT